jgi:hypothetical protein
LGWLALDWCGNVIGFVADGDSIADSPAKDSHP